MKQQNEGTESVRIHYDELRSRLKKVEKPENINKEASKEGEESPTKKDIANFLNNLEQSLESKILNLKETNTHYDHKRNPHAKRESGRVVAKSGIPKKKNLK